MIRIRRPDSLEARIEMMPLIDVIFLLLTFFIYAMLMMVRAELLPMPLQSFAAATTARPAPAATISITLDGTIHLDREPVVMDQVVGRLREAQEIDPQTKLYLALEDGEGTIDRAPLMTRLWDLLQEEGLEIYFVGRPKDAPAGADRPAPSS